jgi:hypothetical protein
MEENRRSVRRRTLKEGKVILSEWSVLNCTIRDLSDGGARLEFGALTDLPKEFRLLIVAANMIIPCALSWQRGQNVGVRFTGPGHAAPPRKS